MNPTPTAPPEPQEPLRGVVERLAALSEAMLQFAQTGEARIREAAPNFRESARNFLHYLALRSHDVRPLQDALAELGLSSLGRCESHALASVERTCALALAALGDSSHRTPVNALSFVRGRQLLDEHTMALLGGAQADRSTRIMVTMPTEAATDYALVRDLVAAGISCARINCAHDGRSAWQGMIDNVRRASVALGRDCRILMDLAGPKLRTTSLRLAPAVLKVKPNRNEYGRVTRPARIWLATEDTPGPRPDDVDAVLHVAPAWLHSLQVGDSIRLTDARGAKREWRVVSVSDCGSIAESSKTTYVVPQTELFRVTAGGEVHESTHIGALPKAEGTLPLRRGDLLLLRSDREVGAQAVTDEGGTVVAPPMIGCTLPEILRDLHVGEPIWFDDGRIGGVIETLDQDGAHIRITQAAAEVSKLRADKGINLPQSSLSISALTTKDLDDLPFVAQHADMVGFSFVSSVDDVRELQTRLAALSQPAPGIVLKVETQRAFDNLPDLMLAAMRQERCGLMIARGDLAIECGFERLAEVQEELLWLCEAAHVPVIWATSVLDSLAKSGMPTRAEVSDAALAQRAECVMLNKGPHILEAVRTLDDILCRMQAHESKKTARLRALHLACDFRP
jgi:pyruvate kinase